MNLKATGRFIIVAPDPPKLTSGSLTLPRSARRPSYTGTLVSAGPKVTRRVAGLTPGVRVFFRPYAGRTMTVGEQEVRILEEHEMLAVLPGVDAVEAGE